MPAVSVVVLECADLVASRRFYEALLGVALEAEQHGDGPVHYSAALEGVVLELYPGGTGAAGLRLGLAVRNRPAALARLGVGGPIRDPDGRRVLLREAEVFHYVGPAHILERVQDEPPGRIIDSAPALAEWLAADEVEATWTVGRDGWLRLAPLRSEHVACAGQEPVLAAGMIRFIREDGVWEVEEITNQSTGYCPPPDCFEAVAAALDRIGVPRPAEWSCAFDFRRCTACGNLHIVKDGVFLCACGAPLDPCWNLDDYSSE